MGTRQKPQRIFEDYRAALSCYWSVSSTIPTGTELAFDRFAATAKPRTVIFKFGVSPAVYYFPGPGVVIVILNPDFGRAFSEWEFTQRS
jgi:hypothetical protein